MIDTDDCKPVGWSSDGTIFAILASRRDDNIERLQFWNLWSDSPVAEFPITDESRIIQIDWQGNYLFVSLHSQTIHIYRVEGLETP
jgi:hypothetical protein